MTENSFGSRVKAARKGKKLTLQAMADKIGTSAGYLHDLEGDKNRPGVDVLTAIARALNVSTDYLLTGHDPPACLSPDELPQPVVRFVSSLEQAAAAAGQRTEDFRAVPLVEDAVAAGAARVMSDQVEGWAWVYGPLLGRRSNLVAVRIAGDSMAPVLPPGSVAVVDRGDRRITSRGAYLVRQDGGCTVKYLELDGHELVLIPENRAHRETRVTVADGQETPVVGRVVWSWTSWAPPNPDEDAGTAAEKRERYRAGKR